MIWYDMIWYESLCSRSSRQGSRTAVHLRAMHSVLVSRASLRSITPIALDIRVPFFSPEILESTRCFYCFHDASKSSGRSEKQDPRPVLGLLQLPLAQLNSWHCQDRNKRCETYRTVPRLRRYLSICWFLYCIRKLIFACWFSHWICIDR